VRTDPIKNRFRRWWARLYGVFSLDSTPDLPAQPSPALGHPVFVVVEGPHDAEFLERISAILHRHDPVIPDLASMEASGKLVFVPFGGGDIRPWAFRLAGTASPEVHIYDAEVPPETEIRQQVARIVNLRPGCRAFVMKRRTLEHYLDSQAIFEACGVWVEVSDQEDVAEAIARSRYRLHGKQIAWEQLPARSRKRRRDKIKRKLNTDAAESMTAERLAHADPDGEIRGWLATIAQLAAGRE
jgi:hypothetical protein